MYFRKAQPKDKLLELENLTKISKKHFRGRIKY